MSATTMIRRVTKTRRAVLLLGIAAGCAHEVATDGLSAEQHRQLAAKDSAASQAEIEKAKASTVDVAPPAVDLAAEANGASSRFYPVDVYNPTNDHLMKARELARHAEQHREAARGLEGFEEDACHDFPKSTRTSCPLLGPVVKIVDVRDGVRVELTAGTRADAVADHMRCHLAYARAHGFNEMAGCPLYIRGLEIHGSPDGRAIELVGHDAKTIEEIRRRSRDEALFFYARQPNATQDGSSSPPTTPPAP